MGPSPGSLKVTFTVSERAVGLSEGLAGEGTASRPIWLLAGFSSSWAVRQASVFSKLLARGFPWFPHLQPQDLGLSPPSPSSEKDYVEETRFWSLGEKRCKFHTREAVSSTFCLKGSSSVPIVNKVSINLSFYPELSDSAPSGFLRAPSSVVSQKFSRPSCGG